ncbi:MULTISPECIES: hypothetical protein [unclassified Janthinobacterium]|uniref:hypothetical protein n=1 Tax=unclassified Janthinobacterium TaxID=2610881 RepID=UPI001E385C05|nr:MULTISPECIES: hypothetical protein [unclassified Janthinobacterium]MCC7642162.1 hypothetical protein [Janthinobacterium sp. EB271-G4-3-1]MCC7690288.1 hypothetical protein [Janthinobacterium sp. EB271-G4-3-2]
MPVGASPKREREFKKLERDFKQEGRYPGREEEVAARIVNKQRAQSGETKEAQERKNAGGAASDASQPDLPIAGYQQLTVAQIRDKLDGLSAAQRKRLRVYEAAHKKRKGVLQALGA